MDTAYGLWPLAIINSLIFIIFAFSFTKPKTSRDWRSFGAFSAFIVALFTEMYGFPLTIYLLSGWLTTRFPGLDIFSHNSGHLLEDFFGWGGDPHFGPFHILSYIFILAGFVLLINAWKVLYKAQREHTLATAGPYTRIRHPQYVGFVLIMFGFLLQWPTIITLIMFPILIFMYVHLARSEEKEAEKEFGDGWREYARKTPSFLPCKNCSKFVRPVFYGTLASIILLSIYFIVVTLVSGWNFTQSQFTAFWYFVVALAIGFGIQIGLFTHLKGLICDKNEERKVLGVTGTTTTATMISCCVHYLANILPVLGAIGIVTFVTQYQAQFFWIGILFNLGGIVYMINKISEFYGHGFRLSKKIKIKYLPIIIAGSLAIVAFLAIIFFNQKSNQINVVQNQTNEWDWGAETDSQGEVAVAVTPVGVLGQSGDWKFDISMNTHSVELDQDLTKSAVLIDERGKEYKPIGWQGPIGGHHREGLLLFKQITPIPKSIKLITGVGGATRNFEWKF